MKKLYNKVVIVTGGANGIGLETAKLLSLNGSKVYVFDIDENVKNKKNCNGINYIFCDVSNYKEVNKSVAYVMNKEKKIDILINNAAKQIVSSFKNYNVDEYKDVINTNYIGVCNCISCCLNYMKEGSTILNILSVHSNKPRLDKYSYDCSKSATECLTKELALEISERNITINALSFGAVETDMNKSWKYYPEEKIEALEKVPLKIIFSPEKIANFIKTLLENFSEYTTGSVFIIDGGRNIKW